MPNMLRRRLLKTLAVLPFWGGSITSTSAQRHPATDASSLAALNVVRLFNTLELSHKIHIGEYASKSELLKWPGAAKVLRTPEAATHGVGNGRIPGLNLASDEVIPGWLVTLHQAPRGSGYLITVATKAPGEEAGEPRLVYASDEAGVIYEGSLNPLDRLPVVYTPLRQALPQLVPIQPTIATGASARVNRFIQRVAFAGVQAGSPAHISNCPCCGTCQCSGQCDCYNCGFACNVCTWCCYPYPEECYVCSDTCSC